MEQVSPSARIVTSVTGRKMGKRKIYVVLVMLALLVSLGVYIVGPMRTHFAEITYEMAMSAQDSGDEKRGDRLLKEACDEGSVLACWNLRSEKDPTLPVPKG